MQYPCPLCLSPNAKPLPPIEGKVYSACPTCELRFLHPEFRMNPEDEKSRYLLHDNNVEDIGYQNFVRPLLREVVTRTQPTHLGLDYGAGTGPVLAELLKLQGYSIELYDPYFWPNQGALGRSYDFVMSCEVVEHFYDPAAEFTKIRGLLKPSGFLGLMTLFYDPRVDFSEWYYRKDPTHVVFYTPKTFEWIGKKFGFTSVHFAHDRVAVLELR